MQMTKPAYFAVGVVFVVLSWIFTANIGDSALGIWSGVMAIGSGAGAFGCIGKALIPDY